MDYVISHTVEWNSPDTWQVRSKTDDTQVRWHVRDMPDGVLWETLNWCVTWMRQLCTDAHRYTALVSDSFAKRWLAEQSAFLALVYTATERGLTFAPATFAYLRRYVSLQRRQPPAVLGAPPPWREASGSAGQKRFRDLVQRNPPPALAPPSDDDDTETRRPLLL